MVARQSAKGIVGDACAEIIAKTAPHKKLKDVKDAAQDLMHNIDTYLADQTPVDRSAPLPAPVEPPPEETAAPPPGLDAAPSSPPAEGEATAGRVGQPADSAPDAAPPADALAVEEHSEDAAAAAGSQDGNPGSGGGRAGAGEGALARVGDAPTVDAAIEAQHAVADASAAMQAVVAEALESVTSAADGAAEAAGDARSEATAEPVTVADIAGGIADVAGSGVDGGEGGSGALGEVANPGDAAADDAGAGDGSSAGGSPRAADLSTGAPVGAVDLPRPSSGPVAEACAQRGHDCPELELWYLSESERDEPDGAAAEVGSHGGALRAGAVAEGAEEGEQGEGGSANLQDAVVDDYVTGTPANDATSELYESATTKGDSQAPQLMEDYVQSADAGAACISDRAAYELLRVLRLCTGTGKPALVVIALRTIQQLIAFRYLQGDVSTLLLEDEGKVTEHVDPLHARGLSTHPERLTAAASTLHLICSCDDLCSDEDVEVAVVRTMLTIVTSTTFSVHGMALLLVVRACYNIFIMSRSETNQVTAKAALTQMVNVVFQRLAAGDVVQVKPVVTSDFLTAGTREQQRDLTQAQALVTSVWYQVFGGDAEGGSRTTGPDAFTAQLDRDVKDAEGTAPAAAGPGTVSASVLVDLAGGDSNGEQGRSHSSAGGVVAPGDGSPQSGAARSPEMMNLLEQGACKVFRALCKLAIRTSDVHDPSVSNGRILAMELLCVILQNNGDEFLTHPRLMAIVKNDLNRCLLHNCKSTSSVLQRLCCSIFVIALKKFRAHLKPQVTYLFTNTLLKGIEPSDPDGKSPPVDVDYRIVVLRCLRPVCTDGQLLIDLFVNYDCDAHGQTVDLFDRLFQGLIKCSTTPELLQDPATPDMTAVQRNRLRQEGLSNIVAMLEALNTWYEQRSALTPAVEPTPSSTEPAEAASEGAGASDAAAPASGAGPRTAGAQLMDQKERKRMMVEGITLFNAKPKKGLKQLQEAGLVGDEPSDVAKFLKTAEGLDYASVGVLLSEPDDESRLIMHAYVDQMDFTDKFFDDAIRMFLLDFRLPGEAQKIDRLMEKFAERYHSCNAHKDDYPFANAQTAYVLAYSVIMLNTDQHNPTIKERMTKEQFKRNNRGIDDDRDLRPDFLETLYDRIHSRQIMMRHTMIEEGSDEAVRQGEDSLMTTIFSFFGRTREIRTEPTDAQITQLSDFLREKAQGQQFYMTVEPDSVRPVINSLWEFILPVLSTLFSESQDQLLTNECLSGLVAASCLTCNLEMRFDATAFINTLAKFSSLHEPHNMRIKNAFALRSLLSVPDRVGSHLHDNWLIILRCLSRYSLMSQVATGAIMDNSLFLSIDPQQKHEVRKSWWMSTKKATEKEQRELHPLQPGSLMDAGMDIGLGSDARARIPSPGVMDAMDEDVLTRIFVTSAHLDAEAIIDFMRALTTVSAEELRGKPVPRVFLLSKIVEVCHHNMMRPRIVWTTLWKGSPDQSWGGLSEYFVDTGCHENLQVSMYAMDALRQISEKFLERDELAAYSFQNDFLKPFVVVMRQSGAKEIRELIIRQASRMVLSRVGNIRSGWKSMFMIFSEAAKDKEATIVRLAFDTIEKIVREHFTCITETDVVVFTDCVNCLTAYTNQDHSEDVALNAIAFLRFCAIRLAEGSIGDVDTLPEEAGAANTTRLTRFKEAGGNGLARADTGASDTLSPTSADLLAARQSSTQLASQASAQLRGPGRKFTDRDEHLFFWTPLLVGLSELTFDPRPKVRYSSLEVLFNILTEHGHCFTESFWQQVYKNMLLPIFDCVQVEDIDFCTFDRSRDEDADMWLYNTCSHCLQHMIDLTVKFYPLVREQLPAVLHKIKAFMTRTHQSLASVGVAAMERLITSAGTQMTEDMWNEVTMTLLRVVEQTLPAIDQLVEYPERYTRPAPTSQPATPQADPSTDGAPTDGEASGEAASTPAAPPVYSLSEGLGLRRMQHVRVRVHVQLLLVQTCSAIYSQHYACMPPTAKAFLMEAMTNMSTHSREINTNNALRHELALWQAEDQVDEDAMLLDPPVLKLEIAAASTLLALLLHVYTDKSKSADATRSTCTAQDRLFQLCLDNLRRFDASTMPAAPAAAAPIEGSDPKVALTEQRGDTDALQVSTTAKGQPVLMASVALEHRTLAPLVVNTLGALRAFSDVEFKKYLKQLFPLMTKLIRCNSAPVEVQVALSDLFETRVGNLL